MKALHVIRRTLVSLVFLSPFAAAQTPIHHDLSVRVDPGKHSLAGKDQVTIPFQEGSPRAEPLSFLLHRAFHVKVLEPGIEVERVQEFTPPSVGQIQFTDDGDKVPTDRFILRGPGEWREPLSLTIEYHGTLYHPVKQLSEEYARSFSETPGLVCEEGVFLCASSYWVPVFSSDLVTFTLRASLPEDWDAVSQGRRVHHSLEEGRRIVQWDSPHPVDEIYLVAGRYHEYTRSAGPVTTMVFLRTPEESLASQYLEAAGQYLHLFSRLIGPYPYSKFALVENFWETGYGMPSFTLLGPTVIRFPFILHSSYPHEILHNWWGNGVFVEYSKGNWCEGLTAYLADHLIKEQNNQGEEYRRTCLQKYTDYVRRKDDFPLSSFHSRHSSAEEAVGYGKCMMMFHMLRLELGDNLFLRGLQDFYQAFRFKRASFDDLRKSFEAVSGKNLVRFFDQWVKRTGAPSLLLKEAEAKEVPGKGYELRFTLLQNQWEEPFQMRVPVAIRLRGRDVPLETAVALEKREERFLLSLPGPPVRIDIDPRFDLFRRLDRRETPPALSQMFGAQRVLILLPSRAQGALAEGYRTLAEKWAGGTDKNIRIALDTEFEHLPEEGAVWIFGWENAHLAALRSATDGYDFVLGEGECRFGKDMASRENHSIVVAARYPRFQECTLSWLGTEEPAALQGLARKLPHYGKYSFLVFEGKEPSNVAKGQWPVVNSPLRARIEGAGEGEGGGKSVLPPRKALGYLAPLFSQERLMRHVSFLASDEMKGRGFGTPELDRAAEYIRDRFQEASLKPGGHSGSYFQVWEERGGPENRPAVLRNVIGILLGTRNEWARQSVVVSAHYDHIGLGWPEVHAGDEGKVHNGADDNASGVSVLLELAAVFARERRRPRSIVFVAFTGEEAGRLGSRHFVETYRLFPPEEAMGNVNLDSVGRLGEKGVILLGAGSAREWPFLFRGSSMVAGIPCESVSKDFGSSDQSSFLEAGVPAVQVFTGAHPDVHRPTDDVEKIDGAGLVKVALLVREAVSYLAEREEPLTSLLSEGQTGTGSSAQAQSGRNVKTGSIPDFSYSGEGVRIGSVSPGSSAEKAGAMAGDIILKIDDQTVRSLGEYAKALARYSPGDEVTLTVLREGKEINLRLRLEEK